MWCSLGYPPIQLNCVLIEGIWLCVHGLGIEGRLSLPAFLSSHRGDHFLPLSPVGTLTAIQDYSIYPAVLLCDIPIL